MQCCASYFKITVAIVGALLVHCGVLLLVFESACANQSIESAIEVTLLETVAPPPSSAERVNPADAPHELVASVKAPYFLMNAAVNREKPSVVELNGFNDSLEGGTARPDAPIRSGGGGSGESDAPLDAGQLGSGGGAAGSGPGLGTGLGNGAEFSSGSGIGAGVGEHGAGLGKGIGKAPALRISREAEAVKVDGGDYPKAARRAQLQGVVTLKVEILFTGRVGEIVLENSSGHTELDAAATAAAKDWKFKPALSDDKPVTTWRLVPIRYVLR